MVTVTLLDSRMAVFTAGNPSAGTVSKGEYGVPKGLVFGYPCKSDGMGNWSIVEGVKLDSFGQAKFQNTLKELLEEQDAVKDLLPG